MKQQIPKVLCTVGFGSGDQFCCINDGTGAVVNGFAKAPMAVSGIVRNLAAICHDPHADTLTVRIVVNGVASALSLGIAVGDISTNYNLLDEVTFVAGDYVQYEVVDPGGEFFPGITVGVCVEVETVDEMVFCTPAGFGTIGVGFEGDVGSFGTEGYSIAALDGSITKIALRRWMAQTGGSWRARIVIDGVLQDGTGGTIDSTVDLDDTGAAAIIGTLTIPVPFVIQQHVTTRLYRLGSEASFGEQCGIGLAILPDIPGQFMFCGGSNDVVTSNTPTWKWTRSFQEGALEYMHTAPAGVRGFSVTAMYIERPGSVTPDYLHTHTLQLNGEDTALTVPITFPADTGFIDGVNARYVFNDNITIKITVTHGDDGLPKLWWGIAATLVTGPQRGNIGPIAWLDWTRQQP